ncbi:MAG: ATP-grasp domain-containing protein [Anaerolineae bacterium]|nr:ATP-grasp domain-containing protein [Anaerolineae bacterium]
MLRLGIMGDGPAAAMLARAAQTLAMDVVFFAPGAAAADAALAAGWQDEAQLREFAGRCDVVTLAAEQVPLAALQVIESAGTPVYPAVNTLAQIQDKVRQFRTMQAAGLEVPRFRPVQTATDVMAAIEEYGFPLLLKARHFSRGGAGNVTLRRSAEVADALEKLRGYDLLAQEYVSFVRELVVIVVRGREGALQFYPVLETEQEQGACQTVRCPAGIEESTAYQAVELAKRAVEAIAGVGVFAVELFELENGTLRYNEISPCPHDAAHVTLEATITSHLHNQIRVVAGLVPGDVDQIAPAAALLYLNPDRPSRLSLDTLRDAIAVGGTHFHLYGPRQVRPGDRPGHVTVLGYTTDGAEKVALLALSRLHW